MTNPAEAHRPSVIRVVEHPDELNPRGITITCPSCGARRDWLLLETRGRTFVRCRCAHEWKEADLDLDYFNANFCYPDRTWPDSRDAMIAMGFDGLLAGAVWS
ncbi:hypothetical protein [Streptacidiphilus jiangxiensis]|uniref:Uncharacterized protein n=1 Tax=Streptacidiphilus jiangxiensis TaxID=235985 RepID=A0A1H7IV22_STRJI|nr:hypothetical protein [Streptacidiphilus jiangxiensis]SEK66299.1 hypothetical protein SAMN05414137_10325 [Streptacidiphilus jiangxiensis]